MLHDMFGDGPMSGMMWMAGLLGVAGLVIVVLLIAALVKYVFFR